MPTLRLLHQQLWAHVINAIDAEFRQPRLMTLQLVLILLSSRPGVNFAQSDMTLSRVSVIFYALDEVLCADIVQGYRSRPRSGTTHRPVALVSAPLGTISSSPDFLDSAVP